MTPEEVRMILDALAAGRTSLDSAVERRASSPGYIDVGVARVDTDRERRRGIPEVIFCEGKRAEDVAVIGKAMREASGIAFGTRCSREMAEIVLRECLDGSFEPVSRTIRLGPVRPRFTDITTAVVSAGTSDRPVAEEACVTLETFGAPVDRVYDVGVAGLHRLLDQRDRISKSGVVIVVAGMEGALASVVGGLFRQPVIAVPTSIGYGAALGGLTPLMAMLTSCAGGMTVVNIDNGFGAAMAALSIVRAIEEARS